MSETLNVERGTFVEITVRCPHCTLAFMATKERANRVMGFVLKEATEAAAEYERSLNPTPVNNQTL